jgi:hypothetical protein
MHGMVVRYETQGIYDNLQALKMLGANGEGDKPNEVRRRLVSVYHRARNYAQDYFGFFKETRAEHNYPDICRLYWWDPFWMEFVNYTPDMKIAFATKFKSARVNYPRLFNYYKSTRFWLNFLDWDTNKQMAYDRADYLAGNKYDSLQEYWNNRQENWISFVGMSPEDQEKRAQQMWPIIAHYHHKLNCYDW